MCHASHVHASEYKMQWKLEVQNFSVYHNLYRCRSEYDREMQALLKQRQEIELQFPTLCLPDPDPLGWMNYS